MLWCTGSFRGALNSAPLMPRDASLSDSCTSDRCCFWEYTDSRECTETTIFPFRFTLNGIWSWWQFSIRFWTKWNSICFKTERKTATMIIYHSMWNEMEIQFSQCTQYGHWTWYTKYGVLSRKEAHPHPWSSLSIRVTGQFTQKNSKIKFKNLTQPNLTILTKPNLI